MKSLRGKPLFLGSVGQLLSGPQSLPAPWRVLLWYLGSAGQEQAQLGAEG